MGCPTLDELVLEVNQGEARGFNFTIKVDTEPMDLTDWTVEVSVKEAPYYSLPSLFTKEITTTSDLNTVGQIMQPTQGQFTLNILKEETLYPPYDYYLVIRLINGEQVITISGDGNYKSIYRVCKE